MSAFGAFMGIIVWILLVVGVFKIPVSMGLEVAKPWILIFGSIMYFLCGPFLFVSYLWWVILIAIALIFVIMRFNRN